MDWEGGVVRDKQGVGRNVSLTSRVNLLTFRLRKLKFPNGKYVRSGFCWGAPKTERKQLPGAAGMKSRSAASSQPAAISLQQFGGVCCHLVLCYRAKSLKLSAALAQR